MDSNSGSLQSSSGDEEYDSRAAESSSFSAFMNPSSTYVGSVPNPPRPSPPQPHHHHNNQITSSMFDPSLSGYNFDLLSSRSLPNQNPLLNLDMSIWSKTLRSDPNCTDPPNILPSSSPSTLIQTRTTCFRTSSPAMQIHPLPENAVRASLASSEQTSACLGSGVVRNSKKRTRASRRAPTTVLTTDTTNFRAMVQEFTGIPSPPFPTYSSPFPRTRLDLFSSSTNPPSQLPPYLLRPFAQKVQPPPPQPFVSSSTTTTTTAASISTNMTSNSTSFNYQLPAVNSDLGIVNINPIHSFQSLLQTSPKYPLPNSNILGSRPPNDDFVLGHHGHVNPHLTGFSRMEGPASQRMIGNNSANWGGGDGVESNDNGVGNYGSPPLPQQQQVTKEKANYLASSSSNLHGDSHRGGSENVSTRSEGMVESWICSSEIN